MQITSLFKQLQTNRKYEYLSFNRKNIKLSKQEYLQLPDEGFEKILFNGSNGGFLVCHRQHGAVEKAQNMLTGKALAKNGFRVKLLRAIKNERVPDALVDDELWEFKMIQKARANISNAIQNHFRRAALNGGQSPCIVLHINQSFQRPTLISGLERAMKADKEQYFQKVMLVHQNQWELLYRKEIYFGKAKRKIKRLLKN